jgi:DNA ligase 1
MLFSKLVETSRGVAETSSRSRKIELLALFLRQLEPAEVEAATAYLAGTLRQGRIGTGYASLRGAIGTPAAEPSLRVLDVDSALDRIAAIKGRSSGQARLQQWSALFAQATAREQEFLLALLSGGIRQGALEGIMMEAAARAASVDAARFRRAVMMAGDLGVVTRAALEQGASGLDPYGIQLFRPVQPMLAQSAEDVSAALEELGEAALEYKMDGARVQVHKSGEEVAVYSRRLNDVTSAVPEIVETVRQWPVRDLILDGEVIALLPDGRPQPFQVTMQRFGRKLEVERLRSTIPLSSFWFDLLYADGSSIIDEPQARRFQTLAGVVPAERLIPHLLTGDPSRAQEFLQAALAQGHEGLMAKSSHAPYAAGARGQSWLKIKQARTLDLVVLAAEWGHGRRRGWLSNLHLGARDPVQNSFVMLGKTFKGLTDEMLAWQTQELLKLEVARDAYTVYVRPALLAEIAFNEIQVSPRYPGGLALRFARVKRYRPDKLPEQADTFHTVQMLAAAGTAGHEGDAES